MRVYKCDRCGKYLGWWKIYVVKVRKPFFGEYMSWSHKIQLCDECKNEFERWLEDPEEKEESE